MDVIKNEIKKKLNVDKDMYNLSANGVKKAIERLKLDKSDGEERLSSDHIINRPYVIVMY